MEFRAENFTGTEEKHVIRIDYKTDSGVIWNCHSDIRLGNFSLGCPNQVVISFRKFVTLLSSYFQSITVRQNKFVFFIHGLFNDNVRSSGYIPWNDRVENERICKDEEESGCVLIYGTILDPVWTKWQMNLRGQAVYGPGFEYWASRKQRAVLLCP